MFFHPWRKVHHNRFEGDLARCSIYDESYNKIVSDESVVNGDTYELLYIQGRYILEDAHRLIQPSLNDLWKEIKSLETSLNASLKRVSAKVEDLNPKSFPRFYVWKSGLVSNKNHHPMIFNEIKYNDGNMYNVNSGKATIQYDGMYIFSTNLYTTPKYGLVYYNFCINDNIHAMSYT